MQSDWFVKNMWLGNEPVVDNDTKSWPMTKETVVEAREHLTRLGEPEDKKDKAALDETLEVLAWAERNLAAGLDILCAHDF